MSCPAWAPPQPPASTHLTSAPISLGPGTPRSFENNRAACRVSEKVGYVSDGSEIAAREDGQAHLARRFRITADQWRSRARPPVVVTGIDTALSYFYDTEE